MSEKELTGFEAALRDLAPTAQPLSRDTLMFYAGRNSAPRRVGFWHATTAIAALVALLLGVALLRQSSETKYVSQFVQVPAPLPDEASPPPGEQATAPEQSAAAASPWRPAATRYEQVRDDVLRFGLDGLPTERAPNHKPVTAEEVLWPF